MNFELPESLFRSVCDDICYLNSDLMDWLKTLDIKYELESRFEIEPKNAYGYGYTVANLNIEDPNHAMLFKLTWL